MNQKRDQKDSLFETKRFKKIHRNSERVKKIGCFQGMIKENSLFRRISENGLN